MVLLNGSPIDWFWSLWTNSPQPIRPSWTDCPLRFGPHGQMVPNQFGPSRQMVPRIFRLSRRTGCGDPEIQGLNWLGTICPGGPNFWGPFVQGDQFYGNRLSRGTGSWGPEVRGSNGFGTKCVSFSYLSINYVVGRSAVQERSL